MKMPTKTLIPGLVVFFNCATATSGTTTYQYDALGRLSNVTEGAASVVYSYDAAGNRTRKQTSGGTATTLTLPSPTAVQHTGSIVLKVTVGGTAATGTVSFYEGSTFLGSTTIIGGVATVELMGVTKGTHNITTTYSGDITNASNSVSIPIKVVNLDWLPAVLEILLN
jgi:YD repeat-containing protein